MTDSPSPASDTPPPRQWKRAPALAHANFRRLFAMRMTQNLSVNALVVAVGWQVYDIGRDPLHLGLIGLVQFLPAVLLVLVTGAVADRFDRRVVAWASFSLLAAATFAMTVLAGVGVDRVWPLILIMGVVGVARAFFLPVSQALVPVMVPANLVPNAIALNAIAARAGSGVGPIVGGILYDLGPAIAYGVVTALFVFGTVVGCGMTPTKQIRTAAGASLAALTAGLSYIRRTQVLFGAITLDIYVILASGVNALLPVFARDILMTDPTGLGMLRASQPIGAALVALILSIFPLGRHAGLLIIVSVGLFGISAITFGLSTSLWLSVLALFVMGCADMGGGYLRWSIVQLWTPDEVRGRVSAVTAVSASGSTELGDFRAGTMGALVGPVAATVFGGALAVVGAFLWIRMFPALWRLNSMERPKE